MDKRISIIIPVYNVQNYLSQCIDSVVNQTYSNLQIILVDDGSTDSSGTICDEWEKKDSRIRVIHKENGGLSDARNIGMNIATGDYIAFVDSDDVIHPRMYEFLLAALMQTEADVAICHEEVFYEDSYQVTSYSNYTIEGIETLQELKKHFMEVWTGPINFAWNKLYKKEVIGSLRFPKGRYLEDIWFSVEALSRVSKVVWIEEKLYGFRQRQGSIMNSGKPKVFIHHAEAILHQREVLGMKEYDAYAVRKLAHLCFEAKQAGLSEGEKEVRKLFLTLCDEVKIRNLPIKDICNMIMAKYCWKMYCFIHK